MVESRNFEVGDVGEAAALLGAVADPIRLGLVRELAAVGEECVCNLNTTPPIPDNLLSYHLKVLRDAGLVTSERRGRWVHYRLAEGAFERLHAALPGSPTPQSKGCECDE